jgi:RNA polymerase sigma-70 factor (ECF subfamily)
LSVLPLNNENELLTRFRQGDETVFKLLFDQYYVAVLYYAQDIVPAKSEAQDIVQESFCKLWQNRQDFNSFLHIKSFLYKVTRFACIDLLRHTKSINQRYEVYLDRAMNEVLHNSRMIEEELYREIIDEISQLPKKYETILRLKFLHNLDVPEIAAKLGMSEATVRKQKQRALEQLRALVLKKRLLSLALLKIVLDNTRH